MKQDNRVLVFGGTGFVGQELIQRLLDAGYQVLSVNRKLPKKSEYQANVQWYVGDANDPTTYEELMNEVQAVVHLIGIVKEDPDQGISYQTVINDTVEQTADVAERAGVKRYIYLSADQDTQSTPDAYRLAKRQAENYLASKDFQTISIRPSMIYGAAKPQTLAAKNKIEIKLDPSMDARKHRPVSVQSVAAVAVAALDPVWTHTPVTVEDIHAFADSHTQAKYEEEKP